MCLYIYIYGGLTYKQAGSVVINRNHWRQTYNDLPRDIIDRGYRAEARRKEYIAHILYSRSIFMTEIQGWIHGVRNRLCALAVTRTAGQYLRLRTSLVDGHGWPMTLRSSGNLKHCVVIIMKHQCRRIIGTVGWEFSRVSWKVKKLSWGATVFSMRQESRESFCAIPCVTVK